MSVGLPISKTDLETLQRRTFDYFIHEANPANGLIRDKTKADWPASIAATGLALAAYPVGIERGFWTRSTAMERALANSAFFLEQPAGSGAGRHRPSGILLSLSRHADRAAILRRRPATFDRLRPHRTR